MWYGGKRYHCCVGVAVPAKDVHSHPLTNSSLLLALGRDKRWTCFGSLHSRLPSTLTLPPCRSSSRPIVLGLFGGSLTSFELRASLLFLSPASPFPSLCPGSCAGLSAWRQVKLPSETLSPLSFLWLVLCPSRCL